ncbi:MAG: hypothetical protein NDI88_03015 [Lysobacter sp.]|nr:hypothetical protein [Lysobacter sp.]
MMEALEHRLGVSGNREKWQPPHDALSTLRVLKPHLRARRDAGRARPVDGPGGAHACIEGALADMARERGIEPGPLHAG